VIGNYGIKKKCPKCEGSGCRVKTPCKTCEGLGVQRLTISEFVYLPRGIHDGHKIRLHNLGHASDCVNSRAGDLLVTVSVRDDKQFKRDDQLVKSEVPISISQAVLGAKLTIDTIEGKLTIDVPPGTQDGD